MPGGNADLLMVRRRRTRKDTIDEARKGALIRSQTDAEKNERVKLEWREQIQAELIRKKQAMEEMQRLKAIEEEEEKKREQEEILRLAAEVEARRIAEEEEAQKAAEEEVKRQMLEEQARREAEEAARLKEKEESEKEAELERQRIKKAELDAIKESEEKEKRKYEEKMLKRIEEERNKLQAFEEAKRKEKEKLKKKQEEDEAKKRLIEETKKKALEDELRRQSEERAKKIAEEREKRKNKQINVYDISQTKDQQALQIKKKNEEEARLNALEEAKQKEIEDALRKELEELRVSEEKKRIQEEKEARARYEESIRKSEEEEAARKAKEEEELRAKEAEELKIKNEQEKRALEEYIKFAQEEAHRNEIKKREREDIKKAVEREKQRRKAEEERLKMEQEAKIIAEQEAVIREVERKKAFEEAERKAIEEYAKKIEERRKSAEESIRLEEEARKQKVVWRSELQANLEKVKKEYDDKLKKKFEEESLIRKQMKKTANLETIEEDGFVEEQTFVRKRTIRRRNPKNENELRIENYIKEQEMKRLISASLERAKRRFIEKQKERALDEVTIKQKEDEERKLIEIEQQKLNEEKERLKLQVEEAKREIENLKEKDISIENQEKLRAVWQASLEESLETTRKLYERQKKIEQDNKKIASDLMQLENAELNNINDEIQKLKEFREELEKKQKNKPNFETELTEDLIFKNQELKAYENYINKYIETENIIESEKNKEEEKKIIIEELETKKLEEKIKAYDAEQELKKKGHDQHDIPEVEANRSAEIEKDRKKLAAAKEKIEIQKKNLNRKKIDRLNREAGLKEYSENARKRDRETIKRQLEIENELRDAQEAARRWAVEANRKKDYETKVKKISEERARRKYLKDVKAQATLNKIKKQNQETAKEKNSVNKSKYNAREASAKLASMIHNFINEKEKTKKRIEEEKKAATEAALAKKRADEILKKKAEADTRVKLLLEKKKKQMEEKARKMREIEHKKKEELWNARKRDRERLLLKAQQDLKKKEEEGKARRQAAEEAKKKQLQEQADKIAQERLKTKQKTSIEINFEYDLDNRPKSTYRNIFDKPKSSIDLRQKNQNFDINRSKTTFAKSDTIRDKAQKSLAEAIHKYIIDKKQKSDVKILGLKSIKAIEIAKKNTEEEKALREQVELQRKQDIEEKRKRKQEEENKQRAYEELKKQLTDLSKKRQEEELLAFQAQVKAFEEQKEKTILREKKRKEEENKIRLSIDENERKDRETLKKTAELEQEIRDSEENARKWAIEEENRLQAKKKAKRIAEERIKKKTKFNEKMKVYLNTYKINTSKSSSVINDHKENQQNKLEKPTHFIRTFDPEQSINGENNTENDVDMDLKKNQANSLADQFHELIESKEDFVSKQKLDLDEQNNHHSIITHESKLPLLKTENEKNINANEQLQPFEDIALEKKIENLASLLHHYVSSHENFKENTQKDNLLNLAKANKQPSHLKTEKQAQVKQSNTVLNEINNDNTFYQNQEIMLHDLIKSDSHPIPDTKETSQEANLKVFDIKKKDNLKSSNDVYKFIENKENFTNNEKNELFQPDESCKVPRIINEERPISMHENKANELVRRESASKEVHDMKIENLTVLLHDLIDDNQTKENKEKTKKATLDEIKLFYKSKALRKQGENEMRTSVPAKIEPNNAKIDVKYSNELEAAKNLKNSEEKKRLEEENRVKLALEELNRKNREKLKKEAQIETEKKQAEENERIRQRLEYIRTEFQERMSKIAEQKALRKTKIDSRMALYHKKYLVNKRVKSRVKKIPPEGQTEISNNNNQSKAAQLANQFHEFIESKQDLNSKIKIGNEKQNNADRARTNNKNLPKLNQESTKPKINKKNYENKDDTLNFSDMSNSLNYENKSQNLTAMFHEFIERSMNGDFSLNGKNMPLGNNETSTPKDQSIVELKTVDSPTLIHKKYPAGNDLFKSPRKQTVQNDKSSSSPHRMIITKPKLPERLNLTKTPRTSDESITLKTEKSKSENLAAMLDRLISQGDMKNQRDAEKKIYKNDIKSQAIANQRENKIEREATKIKEGEIEQTEQKIELQEEKYPEEQSIAVVMFETFGQPLIWSANDDIKEKDEEDFWQTPEEEANQAARYAEIARQNAIKERAERRIDEERAKMKAIEEAAMKSPFMLRRRAGAYGIKQLTKYTKD